MRILGGFRRIALGLALLVAFSASCSVVRESARKEAGDNDEDELVGSTTQPLVERLQGELPFAARDVSRPLGFGTNLVMSREWAAVAVPRLSAVMLYRRSGSGWMLARMLKGDSWAFGNSVALDGDVLVVGSSQENYVPPPPATPVSAAGAVYVYRLVGGESTLEKKLWVPTPVANDRFGGSVAVSGDLIAVGRARGRAADPEVYTFERAGEWGAGVPHTGADSTNRCGNAVAVHGSYVAFGGENCAFVVERGVSGWTKTALPLRWDVVNVESIAMTASTMLVGGPGGATLLRATSGGWVFDQRLTEADPAQGGYFGRSVGIDGDLAIVGRHYADRGAAYLFRRDATGWTELRKIAAPSWGEADAFGYAVGIAGDQVLIGAPGRTDRYFPLADSGYTSQDGKVYSYALRAAEGDSCVATSECHEGARCQSGICICTTGACKGHMPLGAACSSSFPCVSGQCVDGVCCDSACEKPCMACNLPGKTGRCSTAPAGAPHGNRACGADPECGACVGDDTCSFSGPERLCNSSRCDGNVLRPARCDGRGRCAEFTAVSCIAYACNPATLDCNSSCATHQDCAAGAECDRATSRCVFVAARCKDAFTQVSASGGETSCAPYRCVAAVCQESCSSDTECFEGHACQGGRCTARPASAPLDSGCSSAGGRTHRGDGTIALWGVFAALVGRRRSRRQYGAS